MKIVTTLYLCSPIQTAAKALSLLSEKKKKRKLTQRRDDAKKRKKSTNTVTEK